MTVAGWTLISARRHPVARKPDPEHAVGTRESRSGMTRPFEHMNLLPQGEHLDLQFKARSEAGAKRREERCENGHPQGTRVLAGGANSLRPDGRSIFSSHSHMFWSQIAAR
jgi:hypothetical protein